MGKARLDVSGQHMNVPLYGVSFASVYLFGCPRGGLNWKSSVLVTVGVMMVKFR